ncbi:MAG: transposase [Bacteroidales bacterium]|nr:transposase [Bacteroidales bacterium]MCF8404960.1 transposase [Bacteroidales bacterium]
MEQIFKNIGIIEFDSHFDTDEKCFAYLADEKWKDGFACRKCGHTNYCKGKKPHSRRCTKCKTEESATANTIFHKCKFPIKEAFKITYLVCHTPDISSYKISEMINLRQMTCWKFKKKIMECIDSRGDINVLEKEGLKKSLTL